MGTHSSKGLVKYKIREASMRALYRLQMSSGQLPVLLLVALMGLFLSACAPGSANDTQWAPNPTTDLKGSHSGLKASYTSGYASGQPWDIIEWGRSPQAAEFTSATVEALHKYGQNLLASQPKDIDSFCVGYSALNADQKAGFWVALIAGMVSKESGFEPTSMYRDDSMGQDHVTGQPLWSEGLLQISYQDQLNYRNYIPNGACDFDFQADRNLPRKDARRTLQNPTRNLTCGVAMVNSLIRQDNQIAGYRDLHYQGAARYWAVLRRNPNLSTIRLRTLNYCEAIVSH